MPDSEYDFEGANKKFEEVTKDDPGKPHFHHDGEEKAAEVEIEVPSSPGNFYDKKSSFFDDISCETKDRQKAAETWVRTRNLVWLILTDFTLYPAAGLTVGQTRTTSAKQTWRLLDKRVLTLEEGEDGAVVADVVREEATTTTTVAAVAKEVKDKGGG